MRCDHGRRASRLSSRTPEGSRTTPSVVAITESGERLVGQIAKRQSITNPDNTYFRSSVLSAESSTTTEVQRGKKHLPYKIVKADNGDAHVEIRGKSLQPGRDLGHDPAEDEADRRGLPGRER